MASRYIPPHMRNQTPNACPAEASSAPSSLTQSLSQPYRSSNSSSSYDPQPRANDTGLYSQKEIYSYFWKESEKSLDDACRTTLHASAADPEALGYVLLFHGANPKWKSDKVIFVKSNLDLLPIVKVVPKTEISDIPLDTGKAAEASESAFQATTNNDGLPAPHPAFAVFEQTYRPSTGRAFKFVGWYHVSRFELLAPGSEELIRMLQKKWETVDKYGKIKQRYRDAKAWEESMKHKWAVIKMEQEVEATKEKEEPKIERIEQE
ncbi:hypothetical protein GQ43DRAFT_181682 [Delitschia confertaspora ATCC 74209]|uniref:Uncharacterized protein n=1 Tax=Delitschia confertaspora ATCC 74209 TaxID=1513339 RepID=A0A9P4JH98_9PLEO|nr:hypothetical protein GQ43DRAFT_181682 [Delitschia confertaspora ATCC 74209]